MRRNEGSTLPSLNLQRNDQNFSFPNTIAPIKSAPHNGNGNYQLGKRNREQDFGNNREELPSIQAPKVSRFSNEPNRAMSPSPLPQNEDCSSPLPKVNQSTNARTPRANDQEQGDCITSETKKGLDIELAYELEHNSVVCCVKYSNDGKYLATGCNRKAQIFSVETGEKVHTYTDPAWGSGDLYFRSVCFSPNGKYLACGTEDQTVKLWDIENEKTVHTFVGHNMDIYSLDYSNDGNFIVSGSGDKKAIVWDVEKQTCLCSMGNDEVGPKDGVTSVAISPDGRLVASGSLDKVVRLWDSRTGNFIEGYEGHTDSVYSVAFSPDGKSLASGSLDKTLKLWDLSSEQRSRPRCKSTFTGHTDFVLSVAFSADGKWLISGSKDRSVKFWNPQTGTNHAKLEGHKNSVISVAVNPTQNNFATGSGDFKAKVWHYSDSVKSEKEH